MNTLAFAAVLVWLVISGSPRPSVGKPAEPEKTPAPPISAGARERRDPFMPLESEPGERRDVSPIERFTLGELRLVATLNGVTPPRALIEDPSGLGFITVVGNAVGAEHHEIVSIGHGEIVLEIPRSAGTGSRARVVMTIGERRSETGDR